MIILDIEASGLDEQSYPIEIAWVDTKSDARDSFLVNPETSQDDWSYWDPNAEAIHGLAREAVTSKGIDVKSACRRLNSALGGKTVYSDGLNWDRFWIRTLFDGAGLTNPKRQRFYINAVTERLAPAQQHALTEKLATVRPHRALADAQLIAEAVKLIPEELEKSKLDLLKSSLKSADKQERNGELLDGNEVFRSLESHDGEDA